ncbi:hypothetical protein NDU88_006225 [Pleurodeles waltl]|uniref:Uncharacterized protein n=1 Tax=Pleurodeles waltl TaxID=8319 RepID=A0AAV7RLW2_PLEWA|nr:hypothetical protein NDU88_006225 [Pleurodeles waltl]
MPKSEERLPLLIRFLGEVRSNSYLMTILSLKLQGNLEFTPCGKYGSIGLPVPGTQRCPRLLWQSTRLSQGQAGGPRAPPTHRQNTKGPPIAIPGFPQSYLQRTHTTSSAPRSRSDDATEIVGAVGTSSMGARHRTFRLRLMIRDEIEPVAAVCVTCHGL